MANSKIVKNLAVMLLLSFFFIVNGTSAFAASLDDGLYTVEYELLQADSDSVSIANDYFVKPALLKVKDGDAYMQLTVNHSNWVKELKAQNDDDFVDVNVIGWDDEADLRVVEFKIDSDLSEPFLLKMRVEIEEMEPAYNHAYTVRAAINLDSAEMTDTGWLGETESEGDTGNTFIYIAIAVVAVVAFRLLRSKKKNSKES
ncbi:NEAT domain-containing protein [Sporosarcina thermotolerans]|uniref:NEAT domain-containing protein n=1 Tax=Sporosarcina thermotolerans TaxID=633404 RepID=A0AAW9A5D9_9BACL|nr:NEAT domain-containing protein [Sporosarcina thermotolerans]MDW0116075.1 NEAT domain-containing protein [Sporosarcina thermotolerans]WHT48045.1 NEAT domain-containing protein [Sporosarcina thermotolerans]